MESQEGRRLAAVVSLRVGQGADASEVADTIVSTLHEIDDVLSPIIGERSVAALCRRSLHLTAQAYPWLAGIHEDVQTAVDFASLKSVLAQQSGADAAAGGGAVVLALCELLASLIGSSLTERLLRSVWPNSPSDASTHDA